MGRLLFCSLWGAVALCVIGWGDLIFVPLSFLLSCVFFPDSISLMFLFRWKVIVGGFGNSCCRLLLFMRSHPFVTAFLRFLRWGLYLIMYTRGILLFFGLSVKRLFCRIVGPRWSIGLFLGFCILFQSVCFWSWWGLTLSCQDRSWCGFLRWCSFYESAKDWVWVARSSVEVLICLRWFGVSFNIQ